MSSNVVKKQSTLTPTTDKKPVVVEVEEFGVADIPKAMDALGWKEGARFMRHWFIANEYILPIEYKRGERDERDLLVGGHVLDDSDIDMLTARSARFKKIIQNLEAEFVGEQQEYASYIGKEKGFLIIFLMGFSNF